MNRIHRVRVQGCTRNVASGEGSYCLECSRSNVCGKIVSHNVQLSNGRNIPLTPNELKEIREFFEEEHIASELERIVRIQQKDTEEQLPLQVEVTAQGLQFSDGHTIRLGPAEIQAVNDCLAQVDATESQLDNEFQAACKVLGDTSVNLRMLLLAHGNLAQRLHEIPAQPPECLGAEEIFLLSLAASVEPGDLVF